jgi:hypothetical protein
MFKTFFAGFESNLVDFECLSQQDDFKLLTEALEGISLFNKLSTVIKKAPISEG